ncbi:LacI family DNA-binding transcriptional regulator [Actinomyces sp. ZJ308]|uniref:LacI family DNA-binding transcriptional regulator n=1 Tax=Actinomyces sp. ZJ308 TaxID=2708342 RepID=UPI0014217F7A|nr:LacI family DNA-binding transcriptional regulator [Actinomyces sp. ZJ308]
MSTNGHAATQSDIARAAGVSRSLVSLALSGSPKVAADTRRRIQEVAASLGYRVNVSASSLARKRSTIIGLVLPNLRNAFFEQIAACLGRATARRGLTLFVTVGSDQPEVLHQAIESLLGVRVAGIVFVSPWLPGEDLLAIGEEVPVCVIGRRSPGGRVDSVRVDEEAAARLVVDHLAALSMRTICYIGPRMTDEASRHNRERSLARAAEAAGLDFEVRDCGEDAGPATRAALNEHPEALGLVIHNDVLAIDAVPVLRESRRTLGDDVALTSYDNTYLALREEFSLTSVDQPEDLLGERAVDLLCRRAGLSPDDAQETDSGTGARSVVLAPELVTRTSSLGR